MKTYTSQMRATCDSYTGFAAPHDDLDVCTACGCKRSEHPTKSPKAGERTQSAAEFSDEQFAKRKQEDIQKALRILCCELETEEDIRNSLSDRLAQNQQLKTSEERITDGFSILYGDLNKSGYRASKLREAIAAIKAL